MTLNKDEAYKQAIQAYEFLTKKYKSPKDIPKKAWIKGKDIEVGKWYLWAYPGHNSESEFSGNVYTQQHLIMITKNLTQDLTDLWYFTGVNQWGTKTNQLFTFDQNGLVEWNAKEKLEIYFNSFNINTKEKYVVGPLEYGSEFSFFINWNESPWEVKG